MTDPKWLIEARKNLGIREMKGKQHAAEIVQYWKDIKRGGIKDDETPWCAAFTGAMLERVGIRSTRFESANSYLDWGNELKEPAMDALLFCLGLAVVTLALLSGKMPPGI